MQSRGAWYSESPNGLHLEIFHNCISEYEFYNCDLIENLDPQLMRALLSHHLPACLDGFLTSCSLTPAPSHSAFPSLLHILGPPPGAATCWQEEAYLLLLPSTAARACACGKV